MRPIRRPPRAPAASGVPQRRAALLLLSAAILSAVGAGPVAADCQLFLDPIAPATWRGGTGSGYDPFEPAEQRQEIELTVRHLGPPCPWFVTVAAGSEAAPGRLDGAGEHLRYRLTTPAGAPLREPATASAGEVLSGVFPGGNRTNRVSVHWLIEPRQDAPAGVYDATVELTVHEGEPGQSIERGAVLIRLTAEIPAITSLSWHGEPPAGAAGRDVYVVSQIDLGELVAGRTGGTWLWVFSTTRWGLWVESENGALRHESAADPSRVPYELRVAGQLVGLSAGVPVPALTRQSATGIFGRLAAIEIRVLDPGDASAGSYRDVLVLEIVAD